MAELADAHDSKSCSVRSEGSSPSFGICTRYGVLYPLFVAIYPMRFSHSVGKVRIVCTTNKKRARFLPIARSMGERENLLKTLAAASSVVMGRVGWVLVAPARPAFILYPDRLNMYTPVEAR